MNCEGEYYQVENNALAKRNTYSVAILFCINTQGWEIATPTELPGVRTIPRRAPLNLSIAVR